jgi:anti-sigma regulatory factor (Ser/Thr protein kinase)
MQTAAAELDAVRASRIEGGELALLLCDTIAAVEGARLRVREHLAPLALAPRVINRIEVVLEELISNVVRHGFRAKSGGVLLLVVTPQPDAIDLTFEDDGAPFDPTLQPEPPPFDALETAQVGGLGIVTVRRFTRAMGYERSPESPRWAAMSDAGARPVNRLRVSLPIGG